MSNFEVEDKSVEIIKNLIAIPYSQIFDIAPAERDLTNLHTQYPNEISPLIGMMFCAIMLGNKAKAVEYGNEIWNIGVDTADNLEMLYADCLLNIGDFEKARVLISARMDNVEENIDLFYNTVIKYALCTGDLYIMKNLAQDPEIFMSDPYLFRFAEMNCEGVPNKHYKAILRIIYDTLNNSLCTVEYLNHPDGGLQLCLYTSANMEENAKLQDIIFEKINGYYASMQEENPKNVYVRLENVNLHPAWW